MCRVISCFCFLPVGTRTRRPWGEIHIGDLWKDCQNFLSGLRAQRFQRFRASEQTFGWCTFGEYHLVFIKKQVKIFHAINVFINEDTRQFGEPYRRDQHFVLPKHAF